MVVGLDIGNDRRLQATRVLAGAVLHKDGRRHALEPRGPHLDVVLRAEAPGLDVAQHLPGPEIFSMVKRGLVTFYNIKQWTKQAAARGAGNRRFRRLKAPCAPIRKRHAKPILLWENAKECLTRRAGPDRRVLVAQHGLARVLPGPEIAEKGG